MKSTAAPPAGVVPCNALTSCENCGNTTRSCGSGFGIWISGQEICLVPDGTSLRLFRLCQLKRFPRLCLPKQVADGETVFMGVHFPAVIGHIQRVGKLQKGIHLGWVKLMGRFQITVHLSQPLQTVHIHNTGTVPGKQLPRMVQKVSIKPFHELFLRFKFYIGQLLPVQSLIWVEPWKLRRNHQTMKKIHQEWLPFSSRAKRSSSRSTLQFCLNCPKGQGPNCARARSSKSRSLAHNSGWCFRNFRSSSILFRGQHQQETR